LLALLPADAFAFLAPEFRLCALAHGEVVYASGETIREAVFPHDCILSVSMTMADGRTAEVATIGREGCIGFLSSHGDRQVIDRCAVQVAGEATRLSLDALREVVDRYPDVRALQMRHVKAVLAHTLRSIACTSLHTVDLRCARWLLTAHDRVDGDTLAITQDYMAQMLGVRRSTIGQICARLQAEGMIRYSRGTIAILDRDRLEGAACECYGAIRRSYERLLPISYES
jgi:CRP-like cAMP-binding protein